MPEDSLKKRYFYKLSANLIGLAISTVTQAIIPRGLGPKAYGDFNFLSNFFTQVSRFLDMGTSTGFYTKLSQRPKEFGLVSFYLYFSGIVSLFIIGFVVISHLTLTYTRFWPDQKILYIYLSAGWGILTYIVIVLNEMADAYGVTVSTELARILQKLLGMILIILLFITDWLNLTNFFYYHYVILLILAISFIVILEKKGYSLRQNWKLPSKKIKSYIQEFYNYSHPLFIYALVGLIVGILDRWLLQYFAGSVQQGFFGLSYQIGAICFLFTSAMTPLLMREFSIAFGKNDIEQIAVLFRRYIPLLYSITAYFCCFIAIQANKVIYIMGGNRYSEAVGAVTIMAFYSIHQTYGQLSGSVFFSTDQTALYRNIGITFMLIGLPVSYFLIAPVDKMGLNAGATGLAVKMVFIQFITVNVQLYYNAKFLKLSFWKFFGHQILSVGCLLAIALVVTFGANEILEPSSGIIASFLLAGVLYTLTVICLVSCFPAVFGIKREDIQYIFQRLRKIY